MAFPDLPQTEAVIIALTNAFRAENRLAPVKPNSTLTKAARAFAEYLAQSGKFGHEADGRRPMQRTQAVGYKHCMVAENLSMNQDGRGFDTNALARQAVQGWKGSPPHRAAMLQPYVTEIGVGVAQAADAAPKYLSVQLFGRPQSLQYSFRVENKSGGPVSYTLNGKPQNVAANMAIEHTECIPSTVSVPDAGTTYKASDGTVLLIRRLHDSLTVEIVGGKAP